MLFPAVALAVAARSTGPFTATISWAPHEVAGKTHSEVYSVYRQSDAWWVHKGYAGAEQSQKGSGPFISVAELAQWRSPRGLDYKLGRARITIWPYDRSGRATVSLTSGRCQGATGCLATLKGLHLPIVIHTAKATYPILNVARQDVLLPIAQLRAYLGNWGEFEAQSHTVRLDYYPAATTAIAGDLSSSAFPPTDLAVTRSFTAEHVSQSELLMHISIERGPSPGNTSVVRDVMHVVLENESSHSVLFQASRLAPMYRGSLPCWFVDRKPTQDAPYASLYDTLVWGGGGFGHIGQPELRGPSQFIRTGSSLNFTVYTVGGEINTHSKQIRLRYDDGHGPELFSADVDTQ